MEGRSLAGSRRGEKGKLSGKRGERRKEEGPNGKVRSPLFFSPAAAFLSPASTSTYVLLLLHLAARSTKGRREGEKGR